MVNSVDIPEQFILALATVALFMLFLYEHTCLHRGVRVHTHTELALLMFLVLIFHSWLTHDLL